MNAIAARRFDWIPLALMLAIVLGALALIGSPSTWVTLTVAGLAMGLLIFIMASGLTLVFGLMDVMNFAHGLFIAVGAYVAASTVKLFADAALADSFLANLGAIVPSMLAAVLAAGLLGFAFERVIIKPVYGQHLKQILITTGGMIVAEQLIHVFWGPDLLPLARPTTLRGSFLFGDVAIEKFRLIAVIVGLAVFAAMLLLLNRTKIGLLIRAGVENKEMVEAMGYRIRQLFVGVFVVGALLVGLVANYVGYLSPKIALGSNILLMVIILLWRPQGLYPVSKQ